MLRWFRRRKSEEDAPADPPAEAPVGEAAGEVDEDSAPSAPAEPRPEEIESLDEAVQAELETSLGEAEEVADDTSNRTWLEDEAHAPEVAALHVVEEEEAAQNEQDAPLPPSPDEGDTGAEPEDSERPHRRGLFTRLRDRLSRTKDSLVGSLRAAIRLKGKVDEDLIEELEEILIQSDVGVETTVKITERIRDAAMRKGELGGDQVMTLVSESVSEIMCGNQRELDLEVATTTVMLVVGVNGTGKTTTIGKIAKAETDRGRKVMLVAADTFRAAAADQLQIWAERTGSCIVRQTEGADPASVVYEALEGARKDPPDLIMIDTAGRLHNKKHLMEELMKINRVIQKYDPGAPHETILVLDGATGQNAMNQVRMFNDAVALSGLIMTKLDGTAKGGILIAVKDQFELPVFRIGIGEEAEDLRDFDGEQYVDALFSEEV